MKEFLTEKGFTLVSQCSCGGTFRQTFKKNINFKSFTVILMPRRSRFEFRSDYKVAARGTYDDLEETLKEHEVI